MFTRSSEISAHLIRYLCCFVFLLFLFGHPLAAQIAEETAETAEVIETTEGAEASEEFSPETVEEDRRLVSQFPVAPEEEAGEELLVRNQLIFTGIVYGVLICLALINVRLAFWDHDRVFLYAAGVAVCMSMLFALVDGYIPQVFSMLDLLDGRVDDTLGDLAFICLIPYILWCRRVLDVKAHSRWLNITIGLLVAVIVLVAAASLAMIAPINERVLGAAALCILLGVVLLAAWFRYKGIREAGTVLTVAIIVAVFVLAQTFIPGFQEFENIRFPLLKGGTIVALLLMTAGMVSDRDLEFRKDYREIKAKVDKADATLSRNEELEKYNKDLEVKNREWIEQAAHLNKDLDTLRKQADHARIRYQALLDDAPNAVFEVTGDQFEIVQVNIQGEELLRASRDELIGSSLLSFIPENRREFYRKALREHRESGVSLGDAVELERKDGSRMAIEAIPTYTTIDERKITQIYFRESAAMPELPKVKDRTHSLLEYILHEAEILCGVFLKNGKIEIWNKFAENFTGYSIFDLERIGWNGLVTALLPEPEERKQFTEAFQLDSDRATNKEFLLRMRSGEDKTMRLMMRPVRDEDGHIIGQALYGLDLSRQKRLEKDLARFRESEKEKNERLTMLLQEQQVSGERYAHLLSMVSKDLRRSLEALQRSLDADNQDAATSTVRESLGLIDNCISNEVQERTRGEPVMESCDLVRIANEAIVKHKANAQSKSIIIRTEFPPTLFTRVDPRKMLTVFSELVSNAIKFSPFESTVSIQISRPSGMKYARFLVRDAGDGLDEASMKKVFDPFSGVPTKPTAGEAHVGLGLTVARILVQQHKGTIEVHSEGKGAGSTFIVSLPLAI